MQSTGEIIVGDRLLGAARRRRGASAWKCATPLLVAALLAGCSMDELLRNDELPPDIADPAATRTAEGAVAAYHGAFDQFRRAFAARPPGGSIGREPFVVVAGALTDELRVQPSNVAVEGTPVDDRVLPETGASTDDRGMQAGAYSDLQKARAMAGQAIVLLRRFAPDSLQPLAAHLYALQGYTEVLLAELYCSGIPLSTIDFDGDYTLSPGLSTDDVYRHAIALFDSAVALSADSVRIAHLADVGRARALLGLGEVEAARLAVSEVPDDFREEVRFAADPLIGASSFALAEDTGWPFSVSDREGVNGLPFRSSGDPRTAATNIGVAPVIAQIMWHPDKYSTDGTSPVVLADGIEARLIEAEAALAAGGDWLGILNALRTDGTFTTAPNPDDPAREDTLWNAGVGGSAGLAPLEDPEDADARVDLVFAERAAWLFLTGHRQGDLRRLVRHYDRPAESTYPTGFHWMGRRYGTYVEIPVPPTERAYNPRYSGCITRGA